MKENPTFWKYLRNKLWIILIVDAYFVFISFPKSLNGIEDNAVRLGAYFGLVIANILWIGVYYFLYRNKLKEYKKLLKETKSK